MKSHIQNQVAVRSAQAASAWLKDIPDGPCLNMVVSGIRCAHRQQRLQVTYSTPSNLAFLLAPAMPVYHNVLSLRSSYFPAVVILSLSLQVHPIPSND